MEEQKKLRILLLEDNPDDAALVKHVLTRTDLPFISECVDTRTEFNASIKRFRPDVILSDHGLPDFNSNEALRIALKERPSAPFILVTGSVSDEYAISCLREGADDYILKSNLSRLPTAILSAIKKRKLERMKRQARHELRLQNEELSKVNQELDNFVYSVSHNLRGPLATLMGLLNVAKEEDKDHKLGPVHNMMERSMVKLDDTLKEILDYSWNARGELSFSEIDFESTLDTCFQKLEYLDGAVNIEKFIHLEMDEPFYSDPKRIHVLLSNLLSNAILYRDRVGDAMI
ncbi:MAG TPA: response regulator, partial [Chryseolinea sp.]|nr:response regulator [Chryseolinea sp.]